MKQLKKYKHFLNETSKPCADRWSVFAYHNIATIRAEKEAKIAAENSGRVYGKMEPMKAAVRDSVVRLL